MRSMPTYHTQNAEGLNAEHLHLAHEFVLFMLTALPGVNSRQRRVAYGWFVTQILRWPSYGLQLKSNLFSSSAQHTLGGLPIGPFGSRLFVFLL